MKFAVTNWQRRRHRERKLRFVESDSARQAIAALVSSLPEDEQAGIYEAWPVRRPEDNLRVTYETPPRQLQLRPERHWLGPVEACPSAATPPGRSNVAGPFDGHGHTPGGPRSSSWHSPVDVP